MRISDWSSDVCSSDLLWRHFRLPCPLGLIAVLSAWLFWKANCDGAAGAVAAMEAQRLNDPLSNKKRAGAAGSSWGCRVGGTLKRSGAAEGREPAGRSPKRRCFSFLDRTSTHLNSSPKCYTLRPYLSSKKTI